MTKLCADCSVPMLLLKRESRTRCASCQKARENKAHYERHRERRNAESKAYYLANRESALEYRKAYRAANADAIREKDRLYRAAKREQEACQ